MTAQKHEPMQEDGTTQKEAETTQDVLPTILAIILDSTTDSESDQEFLDVLDPTGANCKTKVGDETAIVLSTKHPDSEPDSDSSIHFFASPLKQYQCDRE